MTSRPGLVTHKAVTDKAVTDKAVAHKAVTPDVGTPDVGTPDVGQRGTRPLRWWREVATVLAFYLVYSIVRNTQGSAAVTAGEALANATRLVRVEQAMGLYFEESLQDAFLGHRAFIGFWNLFYGTFHFVVTIAVLVVLYRRFPDRYRRWRTVLAVTTGLALIGFAGYPLMPPRLMPASFGFVDTLAVYGSPWSFESGPVNSVSNQYAAMPSLHFAWAVWCTWALWPVLRRAWARALALVYPGVTLFAVVVTGNHFVLDAAGGVLVLVIGKLVTAAVGHPVRRAREGSAGSVVAPS